QPSGTPTVNNNPNLAGQDNTVVTPRVAAIYHATDKVSVWGDIGSGFRAPTRNTTVRLTWFDNRVNNPVSNITISTVGANVTVQRQNLGETEIQGFQAD